MSLTSQLHHGVLGQWCAENLTGTQTIVDSLAAHGRRQRPVRPQANQVDGRHWANVGGAFGQRLAFLASASPPYYSLLGAVNAGVISHQCAHDAAALWPTHAVLPADQRRRALELRPSPTGWVDLGGTTLSGPPRPAETALIDLQARTVRYLAEHAPTGTLGTPGAEAGLARVCWALSLLEDAYRSGELPGELAQQLAGPNYSSDQLRAVAPEHAVAELVELAWRLQVSGSLGELRRLAGDPTAGGALGTAAPVFVDHWADGDLLIGNTLIDVKTVVLLDNPERTARWLWQLLLYCWLDTEDRYRIRSVGLYLARHGVLVTWGLTMFADQLLGGTGRAAAGRREFLQLARDAIAAEGGRPPTEGEPVQTETLPWK